MRSIRAAAIQVRSENGLVEENLANAEPYVDAAVAGRVRKGSLPGGEGWFFRPDRTPKIIETALVREIELNRTKPEVPVERHFYWSFKPPKFADFIGRVCLWLEERGKKSYASNPRRREAALRIVSRQNESELGLGIWTLLRRGRRGPGLA